MTWQGRNSVDDDGDGLPNLLDRGLPRAAEPRTRRRRPPGGVRPARRSAARVAGPQRPALRRHDRRRARGRDAARSSAGTTACCCPRTSAGCPRRCSRGCGVRPWRRDARLARPGLAAPPGAAHAARAPDRPDAAGGRRPVRRAPRRRAAPARAGHPHRGGDDIDLFAGTDGQFPGWRALEPLQATGDQGRLLSSAVTEAGRAPITATRFGKGLVLRYGLPELAGAAHTRRDRLHDGADGAHMDAPVPLILAALFAAAALVAPSPRSRASAMLGALAIAPVILVFHIADSDQFQTVPDRPTVAAAAGRGRGRRGGRARARDPPVAVRAAGARGRGAAVPRADRHRAGRPRTCSCRSTASSRPGCWPTRSRGCAADSDVCPTAGRARSSGRSARSWRSTRSRPRTRSTSTARSRTSCSSTSRSRCCSCSLSQIAWTRRATVACLGVVVALAVVFAGIGFVEYATRHLFLNPKVIASNQLQDYFRVNSLFFDPNIYGRFLAIVMVLVVAWLIWTRRARDALAGALVLAMLWGGLVLTLSQSSFAVPAHRPRRARRDALERAEGGGARGRRRRSPAVAFVLLAPGRDPARPRQLEVGQLGHERALRPHRGRRGAVRRQAARGLGRGLVPAPVPPPRARLGRARDLGVAHDPDHGRGRAGRARACRVPRAARLRALAAVPRRARVAGAGRRGRGVHRAAWRTR